MHSVLRSHCSLLGEEEDEKGEKTAKRMTIIDKAGETGLKGGMNILTTVFTGTSKDDPEAVAVFETTVVPATGEVRVKISVYDEKIQDPPQVPVEWDEFDFHSSGEVERVSLNAGAVSEKTILNGELELSGNTVKFTGNLVRKGRVNIGFDPGIVAVTA